MPPAPLPCPVPQHWVPPLMSYSCPRCSSPGRTPRPSIHSRELLGQPLTEVCGPTRSRRAGAGTDSDSPTAPHLHPCFPDTGLLPGGNEERTLTCSPAWALVLP